MRVKTHIIAGLMSLTVVPTVVFGADDLILYSPKAVESDAVPSGGEEGILVRGITIRKGDTLKKLSKKYRGRSSYFPQILLFNKIPNPDLIHAGARLRVPVGQEGLTPRGKRRKPEALSKKPEGAKHVTSAKGSVPAAPADNKAQSARPVADVSAQQYREAVAAFKKGQYSRALEGFNRFLAEFPNSPLAADAALYRADSLLNLSKE